MTSSIESALDRIRPRDRQRVANLLQGILGPHPETETARVTISRIGGGGDETQVARWEPADQVGLPDWLPPVLDGQAADAAPTSAKVRIRGWGTGGKSGPSATAVLEPAQLPPPPPVPALPAPAATQNAPPPNPGALPDSGVAPPPVSPTEVELLTRIATLERRQFITDDSLHWHRDALRGANATILALEQELRKAHATLAPTLADRAGLQRELARAERKLERLEDREYEQDRRERKLRHQRDKARGQRDEIAEERDEAESTAEQAIELLREKFGYSDDD